MQERLNGYKAAPDAYKAIMGLETYIKKESGLDPALIHLIKLRASQINGCAYCVDMHVKEARQHGLSEQWINLLSVWRESPVYTPVERAVLEWTEAVTRLADTGAPDSAYEPLKAFFTDAEIAKLTIAIGTINIWNRVAVSFRSQHPLDAATKAA
ncbi:MULTISPECIES: carboxymuconolactone decarboxylase family protein [Shinella]|uniref:Carboxymuconolactone decarboxylase family protein n=1 Tax=Shinella sedimenti TaxID=2919913 RepID=A0ABT0CLZ8_9HYPH|nr:MULTISPECIES: carboxymuconolactone decarboxylase family protein [Shinella]MCJ8149304.1 carboxymuconolactone decarboxylase family protein [Shinella sedimenti]